MIYVRCNFRTLLVCSWFMVMQVGNCSPYCGVCVYWNVLSTGALSFPFFLFPSLSFFPSGDGKTHYIQHQLARSPPNCRLTVSVNEAFTPLKAISKLRTLPLNQKNCTIFFNFTILPPGVSVWQRRIVFFVYLFVCLFACLLVCWFLSHLGLLTVSVRMCILYQWVDIQDSRHLWLVNIHKPQIVLCTRYIWRVFLL